MDFGVQILANSKKSLISVNTLGLPNPSNCLKTNITGIFYLSENTSRPRIAYPGMSGSTSNVVANTCFYHFMHDSCLLCETTSIELQNKPQASGIVKTKTDRLL